MSDIEENSGGTPTPRSEGETAELASESGSGGGASNSAAEPRPDEQYCPDCGEIIKEAAEICPECGIRQQEHQQSGSKDRTTAGLLAILLGIVGAHHFYLDNPGRGVLYLFFYWTLIPAVLGIIEGIIYLTKSDEEFQAKYVSQNETENHVDTGLYCESCRTQLRPDEQHCPVCGSEAKFTKRQTATGEEVTQEVTHRSENPAVSDRWQYGVVGGIAGWSLILTLDYLSLSLGLPGGVGTLFVLGLWIFLPVAGKYDLDYIRANSNWQPKKDYWIFGFAVPFVCVLVGILYLYRRHEVMELL